MSRILVLGETPAISSGFANVLRKLNEYFTEELGHEVEQLGWCHLPTMKHNYSYRIHPVAFPKGGYYGEELFDGIVSEFRPDIVFSLGDIYMVTWVPQAVSRSKFTWIGYFPIDSKPIPFYWTDIIGKIDFPVTYSKFGEKVVKDQVERTINPIRMIYHGIDTKVYYPMDKENLKNKNGMEGNYVMSYVGVNSTRKQIPRLLEAFRIFYKDKPEVRLYLHTSLEHNAGREGWFLREVIRQMPEIREQLVLAKNAGPVGGATEEVMRKTYNITDVFVSSSMCEGFGLPFVEAGACGVPSIGVNYSSIPELIKGRGELVEPSDWIYHTPYSMRRPLIDVREFAEKMDKFYYDEKLRMEYGKKAFEFAQSMDWDNILPEFGELIEDAIFFNESRGKTTVVVEKKELDTQVI